MHTATQADHKDPAQNLYKFIDAIPDFPKPGILFRDISPLLAEPDAFRDLIARLSFSVKESGANVVVGLDSRGFIFGIAVAQVLGLPFVPARKAGKLPGDVVSVGYALEYGEQRLEIQRAAIKSGDRVAIIDDLLATGGTAGAAANLVQKLGGIVSGFFFAIELGDLGGRKNLGISPVEAILKF